MQKRHLFVLATILLLSTPALAQLPEKTRTWTPQVAVGYSGATGIVDELFTGSFSMAGGATYQPRRVKVIGAWLELDYNGYRVSRTALDEIGVANGDLRVWSAAGGLRLATSGKVGFYFNLGLGWYRQEIDLLNPTQPEVGIACNPWWNFCRAVGIVATQNIVGSARTSALGYNTGMGLTFRLLNLSEIYLEVKYNYVPGEVAALEMVPFVLGYRWGS